jgi:hypothetical protein
MSNASGREVVLDPTTYTQVNLLSRAWGVTPGEAVRRLVEHFQQPPTAADAPLPLDAQAVPVHALYEGTRIPGLYYREARSLTITAGPAAGHYKSPSGAATAVLQALNPAVKPNRNGWTFWVLDADGAFLQSVR